MPPPVLFGLALAMGYIVAKFIPLSWPAAFLAFSELLGWILAGGSLAIVAWSITAFTDAGTPVQPHQSTTALVTSGPYRYSRNPIYVALIVMTFGMALIANLPWIAVFLAPAVVVLNEGIIKREEAYLEKLFGEDYIAYKAAVRRYV